MVKHKSLLEEYNKKWLSDWKRAEKIIRKYPVIKRFLDREMDIKW